MEYRAARRRFLALAGVVVTAGCQGFPAETSTPTSGSGGAPNGQQARSGSSDGTEDGKATGGESNAGRYGLREYGEFGYGGVPGRR